MKDFSIEGSVPLKEALAKELGYSFWFDDSVNQNITIFNRSKKEFIGCGRTKKEEVHFVLPRDYEKALEYVKNYYEPEFKVGDLVVVLPEDEHYYNSEKGVQPLLKYREGYYLSFVLGFRDGSTNSYAKIRHATPEEIEEYNNPKLPVINGYGGVLEGEYLRYGCAKLPVAWFKESSNRGIASCVLSSGVEITAEHIAQIRAYLLLP